MVPFPEEVGKISGSSSQGIFLSYRREDSAPHASSLQLQLSQRLPDAQVFMDLDSIEPGLDFAEIIEQAVSSCAVLVAVIGRQWATLTDEQGDRRLDNPDDFVRFEVQAALQCGIRVIPVLVDGARPLRQQDLPAELHKLARLNAHTLSYTRYKYDTDQLVDLIQRVLAAVNEREEAEQKAREEAEQKAREEAEQKAREEAEQKAREEAEQKAREEAEQKAREEAEQKAREEAEQKAREEAEQKAQVPAPRPQEAPDAPLRESSAGEWSVNQIVGSPTSQVLELLKHDRHVLEYRWGKVVDVVILDGKKVARFVSTPGGTRRFEFEDGGEKVMAEIFVQMPKDWISNLELKLDNKLVYHFQAAGK